MVQNKVNGEFVVGRNFGENLLQFMTELIFIDVTVFVECFNESAIKNVCEQSFGQFTQIRFEYASHGMNIHIFQECFGFMIVCE